MKTVSGSLSKFAINGREDMKQCDQCEKDIGISSPEWSNSRMAGKVFCSENCLDEARVENDVQTTEELEHE